MQEIATTCWYGWSYSKVLFCPLLTNIFSLPMTLELRCNWTYRVVEGSFIISQENVVLDAGKPLQLFSYLPAGKVMIFELNWTEHKVQQLEQPRLGWITSLGKFSKFINFEMNAKHVLFSVWTKSMSPNQWIGYPFIWDELIDILAVNSHLAIFPRPAGWGFRDLMWAPLELVMCSLGQMTQSLQTTFKGGNRCLSLKGDSRCWTCWLFFLKQIRNMGKLELQPSKWEEKKTQL